MNLERRKALKAGAGFGLLSALLSVGLISPQQARAAVNKGAFDAKTLDETYKALGVSAPAVSDQVVINASDIAENGAVVPIGIKSNLPNTQMVALLVERNPNPLSASYNLTEAAVPEVTMRVKMGQTSNVIALVKADGKFYTATKEIKITLGGCGG
ncbi:MAG: thiosulfate oxidation carrier protein SoxY [Rhodocyclaceae bacterium]|nr:thiosulfate oxidation carrier protein SoxY [Rhodocyclaceae bacterium]MBX3670228.1 thiosulfate oxidation carrier protein SoxY [Rhodocyclaceae bacterium]